MWPFEFPYTNFHTLNLDWVLGTVKSNEERISANELKIKLLGGENALDTIHPVGSIFISTNDISPAALFGGTWEQLKDMFLLGAGDSYTLGSTGGESEVTLTINQIPNHAHGLPAYTFSWGNDVENVIHIQGATAEAGTVHENRLYTHQNKWNESLVSGGSQAHNNMPPHLVVNIWKRVS